MLAQLLELARVTHQAVLAVPTIFQLVHIQSLELISSE
jgi:hypothetical protein